MGFEPMTPEPINPVANQRAISLDLCIAYQVLQMHAVGLA